MPVVSKQMKTINFSLQSSKNPGWVVRVSSGRYQRQAPQQVTHQRRRRRDKTLVQRVDSYLPTIVFRDTSVKVRCDNLRCHLILVFVIVGNN